MLRLFILRHAKSSWANPGEKDFDRALNERGAQDLPAIATAMRERGHLPVHVYCSPSMRTRLTLHGIMAAYGDAPPKVDYEDGLYYGDLDAYLGTIRNHENGDTVMVIGHNPMCEALAARLVGSGDQKTLATLRQKYPTGALAVIEFDGPAWRDIEPGAGRLVDFMTPRQL